MAPTVLYDYAHPTQQMFAKLTKLLRKKDRLYKRFRQYHYNYYSGLAQQRHEIKTEIAEALNRNCISGFEFKKWQRTIRWKYSPHPLCTVGSLFSPGGRFNIGKIAPELFPIFSCLYAASNKDTALQEALGQSDGSSGLSAQDLALATTESILVYSVSGHLERVFDLRSEAPLKDIVGLMKDFTLSGTLKQQAKKLPVVPPRVISTTREMLSSLLIPDWRSGPTLCEVPANGQIFGQLIFHAGIEGIVYPSKLTGEDCIAVFPQNFGSTSSWIALDDPPTDLVGPIRLDATNWEASERTTDELRASPLRRPKDP